MLQQREQLHLLAIQSLEALTYYALEEGAYGIGLEAGRKLLAMEPWLEAAHCQVMILLAASGQRAQALQQYETCRLLLANELAVEPSVATTDLYKQIQAGLYDSSVLYPPRLPLARSAIATTQSDSITVKAARIEKPAPFYNRPSQRANVVSRAVAMGPPNRDLTASSFRSQSVDWGDAPKMDFFYGRKEEQEQLQCWLKRDACRLIAVLGMGGIGKTALVAKVARSVVEQTSMNQITLQQAEANPCESAQFEPVPFEVVLWRSLLNSPSAGRGTLRCP